MDYPLWHGSILMEVFINSAPGESARKGTVRQHLLHAKDISPDRIDPVSDR